MRFRTAFLYDFVSFSLKSVVFLSYFQYLTSRMHSKYVDYEQQGEAPPKPRVVSSILTAPAIKKPATTSVAGFYFSFESLKMPFHSTKIVRVENFLTVFFRLSGKIVRV